MRQFIRNVLLVYGTFSGIIVTAGIGFWIYRFATLPSSDYYWTRLNKAQTVQIDRFDHVGQGTLKKSVAYQGSDAMFRVIINGLHETFNQRPCGNCCQPVWMKITLFDSDNNELLLLNSDGKHLQCGDDVFYSKFYFHLLFDSSKPKEVLIHPPNNTALAVNPCR